MGSYADMFPPEGPPSIDDIYATISDHIKAKPEHLLEAAKAIEALYGPYIIRVLDAEGRWRSL